MRKIYLSVLFAFFLCRVFAQQYGAQWVIGPNISVLDFRDTNIVNLRTNPSSMVIFLTSACICNASGNLLYFTNGIYIADSNGDSLPNGTGLNPCLYTQEWLGNGLDIQQAALFIPKPADSTEYYLIHFSNDTDDNNLPGTLYYTQVRDSGLGYVIRKNIPFGKGIFRQGGITACKHANGRDYWVVMGLEGGNEYFKYLFTPDSILGPYVQDIGPHYGGPLDIPYSKFSLDGSKYATGAGEGLVTTMDFDRCSGEFSNPVTIFNGTTPDAVVDTTSGSCAVEFSPNGRFLYVCDVINLNQYDLWSINIQDSVELYLAADTDIYLMGYLQMAPNGKVYASTWDGGGYFIHVINYPDEKGDSSNFIYGGQSTLSNNSFNLPNMINYNLGPLVGSGCDTISSSVESRTKNQDLRIMPNPADKYVYVEMGNQGNFEFQLLNALGQIIDTKQTRQVDIFDTENLSGGVYFIKVLDKNNSQLNISKKVVVSHGPGP